jgi:hypothetical protein
MARLFAILKALGTAFRRDQKSLESIAGNNFFLVSVLLLQEAGTLIYLVVGVVVLFPASTDPLRKIPPSRLALWPLTARERHILRAISPWLNPVSWLLAAVAFWAVRGKVTFGLWALGAGLFAAGFLLSDVRGISTESLWHLVPPFPGRLNQLIRKNVREMLSTLDFYCALLLTLCAMGYRAARMPLPAEAWMAMTVLVVLAVSTYAQCLFGLDGRGGLARYRLLPIPGWQILFAKDAAFLLVAVLLTLPLAPLPGIAAALTALAMGHVSSIEHPREQVRWRFSTGASLISGLMQAALMAMAASAVYFRGPAWLLPCVGAWAASLWVYGRRWES